MKTFNYIPLPFVDESPSSIIRRLALMNGYSRVSKLTSCFHGYSYPVHGNSLVQGSRYESMMHAQVGPALQKRIHDGFYSLANPDEPDGRFQIGKLKIGRRLLRASFYPVCSECQMADHFHYINDLCLCSYCPIHQRKLLNACPKCHRPLRLSHLGRKNCICGVNWESPTCSKDDCLPEERLLTLLKQQDQVKLDSFFSAMLMLGIPKQKINRASHLIFDAATALVFDDSERLWKLLPHIWDSMDSTQAEILSLKLKKQYPKFFSLLNGLPHKSMTASKTARPRPIFGNGLRLLLGIDSRLWKQFLKAQPAYDKARYDGADIAPISIAINNFKTSTKAHQFILEAQIHSNCYSLSDTTKILGLNPQECKDLSRQKLLTPIASIRTASYFKKEDVHAFQTSYITTQALAAKYKRSCFEIFAAINRCGAVTPIFNKVGNPFLIHSADLTAVSLSIDTIPHKSNSIRRNKKIRRCFMDDKTNCTLDQAAAILKTHKNTVIYYRDIGLLRCSDTDTRIFLLDDVEKFYERYTTPRILSNELNLTANKLHIILEAHNVHAITGKLINGHSITVYDRRHFSDALKILLNPTGGTFGMCLSQKKIVGLQEAANLLHIKRADLIRVARDEIRPARAPLYRSYTKVSLDEIDSLRTKLATLTPLKAILESHNLSQYQFCRRFITKGFVHPIKFNDQQFLTQSDARKINSFLSEYCTIMEAAKILGLSATHVNFLANHNKMDFYWIPDYGFRHPLLKRKEIHALLNRYFK